MASNLEPLFAYIRAKTSDPFPTPDYQICRTIEDLNAYWFTRYPVLTPTIHLGADTESRPDGASYCVTVSHTPGTGRLIYVTDTDTISHLSRLITGAHLLFHNYLHDCIPFEELSLPIGEFTDTMVRSYNLCLGGGGDDDGEGRAGRGSLGLKVLAYRLLHMRMQSFKDTVYPHSIPHLHKYLLTAQIMFSYEDRAIKRCKCECLQSTHAVKGARGFNHGSCLTPGCDCPKYRAKKYPPLTETDTRHNRLYRKIGTLIDDIANGRCERDDDGESDVINPWKRIKDWHDYDRQALAETIGIHPEPDIAHVPEPELVWYACRDADATLRLYLFLLTYHPWLFY